MLLLPITFREVDWESRVRVVLFEVMFMGKRVFGLGIFIYWVISMDDKYRLMGWTCEKKIGKFYEIWGV